MRVFLEQYIPLAEMLVQTFGQDVEVVLHDLTIPERSVVYVANASVTGRKLGDSFDQLVRQVILSARLQDNFVANYYFTATNGKFIRSSTLLLRDTNNKLQGALCINIDTTKITEQIEWLQAQLPGMQQYTNRVRTDIAQADDLKSEDGPEADDSQNIVAMVTAIIDNILKGSLPEMLTREERVAKIKFMDAKGIFLMKGSIELVAEKLGVNKVTVYSYLDEARGKR